MLRAELETGGDQEANDRGSRSEARQGSDDVQQARGIVYERLLEFAPRPWRQTDGGVHGRKGGGGVSPPALPASPSSCVRSPCRACVRGQEGRKEGRNHCQQCTESVLLIGIVYLYTSLGIPVRHGLTGKHARDCSLRIIHVWNTQCFR